MSDTPYVFDLQASFDAALADYQALRPGSSQEWCKFFWGSHGCSLPAEPAHTLHECADPAYDNDGNVIGKDLCSAYDETRPADARLCWANEDGVFDDDWVEYSEGWYQ